MGELQAERQEAIRRLLHIETSESDVPIADLIAVGFAECALLFLPDGEFHSVDQIARAVNDLFGLRFEPGELRAALARVRRYAPRNLTRAGRRDHSYMLTAERRSELDAEIEALAALESAVLRQWGETVAQRYSLDQDEVETLLKDQSEFNARVLLRYGAQTQAVLCGTREIGPDANLLLSMESVFASLPQRDPYVSELRKQLLVDFWSSPDANRARYLARLLDNACVVHTAHIDPKCSALVRGVFQSTLFYLDTNVIYRLLNLQGPRLYFQTHTLADTLRRVGGKLVVSQMTMRELRTSLRANERWLRIHPIASPVLAKLAAEASYEDDFVSLYFSEYARTSIGVSEFAARIRNVDALLSQLGVVMDDDPHTALVESPAMAEETRAVYRAARGRIAHDEIATHDAFHRLLVLSLRGAGCSFAHARAWFLTCDGKLGRYDRDRMRRSQEGQDIPFCIYPDHCIQMTRWALPRTADYDRAFVELVGSPYVSAMAHTARLPSHIAQLICSRIDRYREESNVSEETASQIAVLILVDQRVEESFRSGAPEPQLLTEIDDAITRALREIEHRTEQAERARAAADRTNARLAAEKEAAKMETEAHREAIRAAVEARDAAVASKNASDARAAELRAQLEAASDAQRPLETRAAKAESLLDDLKTGAKWLGCAIIWCVLITVYRVLPWATWPWWAKPTYEAAAPCAAVLALGIPLGFKKARVLLVTGAAAGTLICAYLQLRAMRP